MLRRVTGALAFLAIVWLSLAPAQEKQEPVGPPTVLEMLLPAGARATADGKELAESRLTLDDLKPTEVRRVKLAVKFPDGTTDERLVDVSAGQRLPISVPRPGPDK